MTDVKKSFKRIEAQIQSKVSLNLPNGVVSLIISNILPIIMVKYFKNAFYEELKELMI